MDALTTAAMGTTKQGDTIDARIAHDPRASYGRSVIPTAKRNVARLHLWDGWQSYEASLVDTDESLPDGRAITIVRFVRTR